MARKQTQDEILAAFRAEHGDRYGYDKVLYTGSTRKVVVTCAEHGDFEITPNHHRNGTGCRQCYFQSRRLTRDAFITNSRKMHGDRYDYSSIPDDIDVSRGQVDILCRKHGTRFKQSAKNHMHGHSGCEECISEKLTGPASSGGYAPDHPTEKMIARFREKHGDTWDYSRYVYKRYDDKGIIICREHGPFEQTAGNHLKGSGCPTCAIEKRKAGTFKSECAERGVDYWRALKRREGGMSDAEIFADEYLRSERKVNEITVEGVTYPNIEAACRAREPMASSTTILRWLREGMDPDEAFNRIPNPGVANGTVYVVEHKKTGKSYVGLTVQTLERRFEFHRQQAAANYVRGLQSLHHAIREEGMDVFSIREVDRGQTKKDLEAKEKLWIERLKTLVPDGYNLNRGGSSGGSNKIPTEVDGIVFPSAGDAADYVMRTRNISRAAARRRISKKNIDVRTPAPKGKSLVKTKAYKAWSHIVHAATNPKSKKDYLPGVSVHEPWREFDTFLRDVGQPPHDGMAFVRIDKARGFYPDNCQWLDRSEAARLNGAGGRLRRKRATKSAQRS